MTYQRYYGRRILLPIYVFYVSGGEKNILVDTGLDEFVVPPDAGSEHGLEIMSFEDALASVGLRPADIDIVIHTHLHNDHCENDYKCKNAKVYVQKAELDFCRSPHPIDHRYYSDLLDDIDIVTLEGDHEVLEGIGVILTPGHSPGGQSVAINTSEGKAIITGFCCNALNFPDTGPVVAPGVHINAIEAYESARRIRERADILIPLHDLSVGRSKKIPG